MHALINCRKPETFEYQKKKKSDCRLNMQWPKLLTYSTMPIKSGNNGND